MEEDDIPLVPQGKTTAESIAGYLGSQEPFKALELLVSSRKDIPDGEASPLYNRTLSSLQENYNNAMAERRYTEAEVLYTALNQLYRFPVFENQKPELPDGRELYTLHIKELVDKKWYAPAITMVWKAIRTEKLSKSDFQQYYDWLLPSENGDVLDALVLRGGLERRHKSREKENLSKMIDGTVTIWVDRGVRVDHGRGTPDIVIGSGFFVDKSGYLLTNYHVIQSEVDPSWSGYSRLFIRFSEDSPEKIPARVVGWDPLFDLALIKLEMDAPFVFPFAGDDTLQPGQQIRAIGSPAGLMRTVTSGAVSSTSREFLPLGDVVQVDVPINPGNSGGPLLNTDGEIVGVVFAGIEQFEGINFAIPGRYVKRILPALYQGGVVTHSWLGLACVKEINDMIVIYAAPGSPADKAGIEKGDILVSLNDIPVTNMTDMKFQLMDYPPGTPIKVSWKRGDSIMSAVTVLHTRPENPIKKLLDKDIMDNLFPVLYGFEAEPIGKRYLRRYRITRVYSATLADEIGFASGDLISLRDRKLDEKAKVFFIQFIYQGQKDGFLDSLFQMAAPLETSIFL